MNEEFTVVTGVKAGIKSESLELTADRKIIIDEMIDDELSDYSFDCLTGGRSTSGVFC